MHFRGPRPVLPRLAGSLRQRLVLLFTILLLPPTVVSAYLAWEAYSEHTKQAKLSVRQLAVLAATFERKFFEDTRKVLQRIANEPAAHGQSQSECNALLTQTLESAEEFAGLAIYDPRGELVCGTGVSFQDVSSQSWFRDVLLFRSFTVSDYTHTPDSPFPVIVAAVGIFGEQGAFKGILSASIELYWLGTFLKEAQLPSEGVFLLLDSKGDVLASSSLFLDNENPALPKEAAKSLERGALRSVVQEDLITQVLNRQLVDFEAIGNDGVRRLYSSVALPHGNVTLLFGAPSATTLGWIEQDFITRLLGLAAIWAAGIGAAWLGTRQIVARWTGALRRVALAYARGDYSARLDPAHTPTELRDLGDTLMLMARRVEAREADLRDSLTHKDTLIKEIHHRVKNNLQIVSSLLNLHGKAVEGPAGREALEEVKIRVRALALVHHYLYERDDVQVVGLGSFVTELCQTLVNSLTSASRRISLKLDMAEIMILSDRAVPIALLVVEAVTNSLKHAFPDGRHGEIAVRFKREGRAHGVLEVSDNGVGLPPQAQAGERLGLRLIGAFAKQVGGELSVSGPPGTVIRVRVKLQSLTGRIENVRAADDGAGVKRESAA